MNAKEKRYDRLRRMGCIPCRHLGVYRAPDMNHLVDKGTRKLSGGDRATYPSCEWHHRGVPPEGMTIKQAFDWLGPSKRLHGKKFAEKFGTERSLMLEADALILKDPPAIGAAS